MFRASVTHRSICSHMLEEYNCISKILGRGYAICSPRPQNWREGVLKLENMRFERSKAL
jgi:hypothetical protein